MNKINYVNSNIIMVINPDGKIRQLSTPFKVQVIKSTGSLVKNSWVTVDAVVMHRKHKLSYNIFQFWYPYNYFRVVIKF